jgi:hypothetical protein
LRKFSGALFFRVVSFEEMLANHEAHEGHEDSNMIFDCKLRALRVLRGEIAFSFFVAAPPR